MKYTQDPRPFENNISLVQPQTINVRGAKDITTFDTNLTVLLTMPVWISKSEQQEL